MASDLSQATKLKEAFNLFNSYSEQLTSSYAELEGKVAVLTDEVSQAHKDRLFELAEKERLASRLTHIIDAIPAGVVVLDGNGIIQESNPVAQEMLSAGCSGTILKGQQWYEVIQQAFQYESLSSSHELTLNDGRVVSLSTQPLGTEPGQTVLLKDVTEVRELERLLEQDRRLKAMGEMVASLAHQIRTPLSAALLYGSQLSKYNQNGDSHKVNLNCSKIQERLQHLEQIISDMLSFGKGSNIELRPVTVDKVLNDLKSNISPILSQKKYRLLIKNIHKEVFIKAHYETLLSALQNIVMNSIESNHSMTDGMVHGVTQVICSMVDLGNQKNIRIQFYDNGPGMSKEAREHAFDPFYTTRDKGTGLGLAVVKTVVESHGGSVWVDEVKSGCSVSIQLPLLPVSDNKMRLQEH